MTKIDIFSGFLGAGKTTLIKKLIKEAYAGEKLVLIENEFGEIGIDGGFMKESGINITEMNSGCICCSLVGDFSIALKEVLETYSPDRILIEPSGVGKLSDVIRAVMNTDSENIKLNSFAAVADAKKCRVYMKNFGEFFNDQIEHAGCILLSHTDDMPDENIEKCVNLIRAHNESAVIVTTPWDELSGAQLLGAMERKATLDEVIAELKDEHKNTCPHCGHHQHHHEECEDAHHHEHSHEHHHHADDVFDSWGAETVKKYTYEEINNILVSLLEEEKYGMILRAKGMVENDGEGWIHFDYIPGEPDIRDGGADITGKICVIGSKLNKDNLKKLFGLE